jgi:N-terminal domain of reverse transcriptase
MGWIGVNEESNSIPRESGQTSARSFMTRKCDETTKKGKQMTEELQEISTGAPFQRVTGWHAIDWQSVRCNVRRLQTRIVKATKEKRWAKVKAFSNAS